jgi:hypothetical protein
VTPLDVMKAALCEVGRPDLAERVTWTPEYGSLLLCPRRADGSIDWPDEDERQMFRKADALAWSRIGEEGR